LDVSVNVSSRKYAKLSLHPENKLSTLREKPLTKLVLFYKFKVMEWLEALVTKVDHEVGRLPPQAIVVAGTTQQAWKSYLATLVDSTRFYAMSRFLVTWHLASHINYVLVHSPTSLHVTWKCFSYGCATGIAAGL